MALLFGNEKFLWINIGTIGLVWDSNNLVTTIEIIFSLLPFFFSYFFYKRSRTGHHLRFFFDSILYGIFIAAIILSIISVYDIYLPKTSFASPVYIGFFQAAFIEKIGAFLFLYIITKKQKESLKIINIINFGIFYAAGFAALENIIYAMKVESSTIFIRSFSSVILHLTTCSIMAYFIALAHFFYTKKYKVICFSMSFLIPYLCHGIYDTFLLMGGSKSYIIGPELAILIFTTEYIIAHSTIYPVKSDILKKKITLEDWIVLNRQSEYDRWILLSMDKKNQKQVPFYKFSKNYFRWTFIFLLLLLSIVFIPFQFFFVNTFNLQLSTQEAITLFVLYPAIISFYLIILGAINPDYFKYSRISIPILAEVNIGNRGGEFDELSSDINRFNCFIKSLDSMGIGTKFSLRFKFSRYFSPKIQGEVIWDNQTDVNNPFGCLLRFEKLPKKFNRFLFRYNFFKFWKGFLFNLKIPGFEQIRKFFVKTLTVMEDFTFYPEGTILFKEGEIGDRFFLLKRGNVRIYKTLDSGEEVELTIVKPGEIFGEMAILGNQERAATAHCIKDCMLAVADGDNLDALIRGNPEFSQKLIQTLAIRVKKSEHILTGEIHKLEKTIQMHMENSKYDIDFNIFIKSIVDILHQPIIIINREHKILYINQTFEKFLDIPFQAILGKYIEEFLFLDINIMDTLFDKVPDSGNEYTHKVKIGRIVKVGIRKIYFHEPNLYLLTLKIRK